jgi:hypothetical protein
MLEIRRKKTIKQRGTKERKNTMEIYLSGKGDCIVGVVVNQMRARLFCNFHSLIMTAHVLPSPSFLQ